MVKATERCGGARETTVMTFLGMSSELKRKNVAIISVRGVIILKGSRG